MAEEIGFENGRNSNFQWLVTLTLTLDPAIRHTVVHHSSTSTYIPNFIEIEETFCGRTDGRTDVRTDGHFSPSLILLDRLLEVDLIMCPEKIWGSINIAFLALFGQNFSEAHFSNKKHRRSEIGRYIEISKTSDKLRCWLTFIPNLVRLRGSEIHWRLHDIFDPICEKCAHVNGP